MHQTLFSENAMKKKQRGYS